MRVNAQRVFLVIVAGFVVTILAVGRLTGAMRPVLPWWSIVIANALATVFARWYLVRQRPGLYRRLVPFTAQSPRTPGDGGVGSTRKRPAQRPKVSGRQGRMTFHPAI